MTKRSVLAWFPCAIALASCQSTPPPTATLRDRILAARPALHCTVDCVSPHILAIENGYMVTSFLDGRPQRDQVRAADLARYLAALPMAAWPNGPDVIISRADVVIDAGLIERHFAGAQRLCRSLGLTVQTRPGG